PASLQMRRQALKDARMFSTPMRTSPRESRTTSVHLGPRRDSGTRSDTGTRIADEVECMRAGPPPGGRRATGGRDTMQGGNFDSGSSVSWPVVSSQTTEPRRDERTLPERDVVHLDIAAFAVAVERVREPRLRGRPVVVAPP